MDDAAVVRPPGAERALVMTMDVITPIVDDARAFGAIAAANSLSDVYAMGGRAEVALSFVGLPVGDLPPKTLDEVLAGISDSCVAASCAVVGGHTMKDSEPKCGLAVVGSVARDTMWSHAFAKAGDLLILTKPIGTGLVGQSVRQGTADPSALTKAVKHMRALNRIPCEVGLRFATNSCTDITGFGLLGHLRHIVEAAGLRAEVHAAEVPLLPGVVQLANDGCVPGGSRRNLTYAEVVTSFADSVEAGLRLVLADAQTSGGLLLTLPETHAHQALTALHDEGITDAAIIGQLAPADSPSIFVN